MGLTFNLGRDSAALTSDASLNVGIGGSPSGTYKLEVTGTIRGTGSAFDFYTSSGLGTSSASGLMRVITSGTSSGIAIGQSNSTRYTSISANDYKIYNDDFFLTTNGAFPLSIGTNNTARLTIASTGAATFSSTITAAALSKIGDVYIGGRAGTYASYPDGIFGDNLHIGATGTGGGVYVNAALSRTVYINPIGGNVGIGTFSPSYQLQLSTDSAGKPNGGSWANSSDIRLKENVKTIDNALDKIMQLRGVTFDWKDKTEQDNIKSSAGFIADEVMLAFPTWVKEVNASSNQKELINDDKVKSLSLPFEFDAMLVEAIKELNQQNQDLKSRLDKAGL